MTQLNLPFDIGIIIPEDDSVLLLTQFVEELNFNPGDTSHLVVCYNKKNNEGANYVI